MSQRRKSILINDSCNLGWSLVECRQKCMEEFEDRIEQDYIWIQEVLIEIKKKFNSPEVQLCPKTPSANRKRNARSRKQNSVSDNTEQSSRPRRNTRRGKATQQDEDLDNTATSVTSIDETDANNSTRSTRSTRSNKAGTVKSSGRTTRSAKAKDDESSVPEPIKNLYTKEVSFKPGTPNSPDLKSDDSDRVNQSSVIILDSTSDSEDEKPLTKRSKTPTGDDQQRHDVDSDVMDTSLADSPEKKVVRKRNSSKKLSTELQSSKTRDTPQSNKKLRNCSRESPRAIPNFAVLNVKGKAQAYEDYVTKNTCDTDEAPTPKAKSNLPVLDRHDGGRSPYTSMKSKTTTATAGPKVVSVKGGGRMSLSKRRSSIIRHKLRQEVMKLKAAQLNKQDKNQVNESLKSSPEKSPTVQTTPQERRCDKKSYASATKSSEAKRIKSVEIAKVATIIDEQLKVSPKQTCEIAVVNTILEQVSPRPACETSVVNTNGEQSPVRGNAAGRSKLQLLKSHPHKSGELSSDDGRSPVPLRTTRSKMRKNQPPKLDVTLEEDSDEDDDIVNSSTPIQRVTRSKIRKNQQPPPSLPTPPSDEDGSSTPTMSSDERKDVRSVFNSGDYHSGGRRSVKRNRAVADDSDESSPPKRQCVEDTNWTSTPSHKTGPRIVKPVKGGAFFSKQPVNLNSTARSFVQRNTPKKKTTKEAQEQKQKLLAQKEKEAASRLLKREESLQKKREEARRLREQRQKAVAQRREEREKELKIGMAKKMETTKDTTFRVIEDKRKETEKEKQKLRDKKMAEAEMRRKQEEDLRLQRLKEQALEHKRQEEIQQRKKEFEEKERQRRLAEQKRQEEERRQEQERERQRELEKQRQYEDEMRRRDEALRKEREDRERRERLERERQEKERQEERERIKRMEIERQKELERQRLMQQQKALQSEQKTKNEEKQVLAMIQKHNNSLSQNNSMSVSKNTSLNTSGLVKPGNKLNTSYTIPKPVIAKPQREENPDSYEITPVKVKVYKCSGENYNIDDIKSDDSTDDEDAPKKKLPSWASGGLLRATIINQTYQPPNLDEIFGTIDAPDLNMMFAKKRARFNKRTSSAIWESPILKHV